MATPQHRLLVFGVLLVAAALTTSFVAQAAGRFASLWFLPLDSEATMGRGPAAIAAVPLATRTPRDPDPILRRNVFDSKTDLFAVAEAEVDGEDVEPEDAEEWDPTKPLSPCEGSLRLVGALVDTRREEQSFAAITTGAGDAVLFRPNMTVDGREVLAIRVASVVLRPQSGSPCRLAMFDPSRPTASPMARPAVAARAAEASGSTPGDEALDQGITKVNDTQFSIQRSLLDSLLEDQAGLMKLARVIPHQENGRTVGVKLYGIRRNSVLGRLGIQNGDMLRSINGFDMSDATGALEAFAKLRNADSLSVSLVRRGNPQNLEYSVQ